MPSNPIKSFDAYMPVRIVAGENKVQEIGSLTKQYGSKAYLVTMKNLIELGLLKSILRSLDDKNIEVRIFDGATSDPKVSEIDRLALEVKSFMPDFFIGVGGGSCIDLAKAISMKMSQKESIWLYAGLSNRPPLEAASGIRPIIAVPTTSGTGSEVTPYAVLLNEETRQKGTIKNLELFPKISIVDPTMTISLPANIPATTALDAFAHALESYLNSGRTPFSSMLSLNAMRTIHIYLPKVLNNGRDIEARFNLAWASSMAGMAISQVGTTVPHIIAEVVGALNGFPHASAIALFTPPVIRRTYEHDIERFCSIADALDGSLTAHKNDINKAKKGCDLICALFESCMKYLDMNKYDFSKELANRVPDDLFTYKFKPIALHPKEFSRSDIQDIVNEGFRAK